MAFSESRTDVSPVKLMVGKLWKSRMKFKLYGPDLELQLKSLGFHFRAVSSATDTVILLLENRKLWASGSFLKLSPISLHVRPSAS